MNNNHIVVYDFETGSKFPQKAQVTQLAAVVIDCHRLEIIEGSIFNSFVKPILDDDAAIAAGFDPVEQEALDKTHITREMLESAPSIEEVWKSYVSYLKNYCVGNSDWDNPIPCGYNINNFDKVIIHRLCEQYGPFDKEYSIQRIYHPVQSIDIMQEIFLSTESIRVNNQNSISFDSIREWFGMSSEGSHNALNDVIDCAELAIRFIKLRRKLLQGLPCVQCATGNKVKFKDALTGWTRPSIK